MSPSEKRLGCAAVAVAGLLLLTAGGALAKGPPVVNQTDHFVNETTTVWKIRSACGMTWGQIPALVPPYE